MNAKGIIEIIAREKNMTPEAVEYEMRSAIREAMASEKPDAKAMYSLIDKLTSILSVWLTGFVCICAMRR